MAGPPKRVSAKAEAQCGESLSAAPLSPDYGATRLHPGYELVSERKLVAASGALRHAQKELVERDAPLDQALLVRVADQRLQVLAVAGGQSVLPRIATENL